ncbi:MAG: FHA domain-containing protein [Candidatus Omnitrophota bacterium]
MSLTSFFKKVKPEKTSVTDHGSSETETAEPPKVLFEKLDTGLKIPGACAELTIYANGRKISIYSLGVDVEETRIGRDPSQCDIAIPELIVSKYHCSIMVRDRQFFILDHHSTNGVYVNNEKITAEHRLENGDVILLGKKGTVKIIFQSVKDDFHFPETDKNDEIDEIDDIDDIDDIDEIEENEETDENDQPDKKDEIQMED